MNSRRLDRIAGMAAATLFFAVLAAVGCTMAAICWTMNANIGRCLYRQLETLAFPTAPGVITRCRPAADGWLDLEYTYQVDGVEFTGASYRRAGTIEGGYWPYWDAVRQAHPVGRPVEVSYHPDDPRDALLSPGWDAADLLLPLILMPFQIPLLICLAAAHLVWREVRYRATGGAPLRRHGGLLCVECGASSPAPPGVVAMVVGPAFVLGWLLGVLSIYVDVPARIMVLAWEGLFLAWILAWRRQRIRAEEAALLIDRRHRLLVVPRTGTSELITQVAFEDVCEVTLKWPTEHYEPTVAWINELGWRTEASLGQWTRRAPAERLVGWLNRTLEPRPPQGTALPDRGPLPAWLHEALLGGPVEPGAEG